MRINFGQRASVFAICLLLGMLGGCGTMQTDHYSGKPRWWPFIIEGETWAVSVADISDIVAQAKVKLAPKGRHGKIFKVTIVSSQIVQVHYGADVVISGEYLQFERKRGKWEIPSR